MDTDTPHLINDLIDMHSDRPGALLPILHQIQDTLGYIPVDAVTTIASALNLSRAEVHGVISYYHYFHTTPPARNVIKLCRAEACQAQGGEALAAHAEACIQGHDLTLEPVYCLGLCANGPAMQINENSLHARLTPEKFEALIDQLKDQS